MEGKFSTRSQSFSSSFLDEHYNHVDQKLPQEIEEGNVEYKLKLVDPPDCRIQHLVSQMKWRLAEGVSDSGRLVGLSQNDLTKSLETLRKMGALLQCDVTVLRERFVDGSREKTVAEVLVRKKIDDHQHFLEIRLAIIGSQDSGKSTFLGVITQGHLDNARGKARLNLLRHRHEILSGRTSSMCHEIIGFNSQNCLINYSTTNISSWEQICEVASKVISFLDLPGGSKYERTTLSGLTGGAPDYVCVILAADAGRVERSVADNLGVSVALNVPIFVVITKIDCANVEQLKKTLESLFHTLKSPFVKRLPLIIDSADGFIAAMDSFTNLSVIPVFLSSSVTGENIELIISFFNMLKKPVNDFQNLIKSEPEFYLEEIYNVPDVGCVLAGIIQSGQINIQTHTGRNTPYYIGPFKNNTFQKIQITSIHRTKNPVSTIQAGQAATLAISLHPTETSSTSSSTSPASPSKLTFRRGQVVLGYPPKENSGVWEFEAELFDMNLEKPITKGKVGVVYCGSVRQGARVFSVRRRVLRLNLEGGVDEGGEDGKIVLLRFLNEVEYIKVGQTCIFRGDALGVRCVGKISRLISC